MKTIRRVRIEYEDGERVTVEYAKWREMQREVYDQMAREAVDQAVEKIMLCRVPALLLAIIDGELAKPCKTH